MQSLPLASPKPIDLDEQSQTNSQQTHVDRRLDGGSVRAGLAGGGGAARGRAAAGGSSGTGSGRRASGAVGGLAWSEVDGYGLGGGLVCFQCLVCCGAAGC